MFLFSGLIAGGIPAVIRSHHDMRPGYGRAAMLAAGALLIILLPVTVNNPAVTSEAPMAGGYVMLALGGFLAGGAMIVPGVSGSFILLILGQYENIVQALKGFDLAILAIVGISALSGIVVFSRVIFILLKKFPAFTYYFILGLIAGSLLRIFPGVPGSLSGILTSCLAAAAGFMTAFAISIRDPQK
jgi:putative membrane protein